MEKDPLLLIKSAWNKFPEQVKRLSVLLVIVAALLVAAVMLLVPPDFGKYGHYRASAVDEIISQEINYAGQQVCAECHDDAVAVRDKGYHKDVSCEVCHGPAALHVDDEEAAELQFPRGRGYCPLCHEYLPARPTGFPQIVAASHNPLKACINCHDPHDPVPPETPKECKACHASIARTKSLSHHIDVPCTRCHEAPEEHKIRPREIRPTKPVSREFCGECHGEGAESPRGIPRVDVAAHGGNYVCWQCHYPHLPEAK